MNRLRQARFPRAIARAVARPVGLGVAMLSGVVALLAGAGTLAGCKTTYNLEDRDTPTQVVVEARGAGPSPSVVVYVGDRKGFDGAVRLDGGPVSVAGPLLSLRAGDHEVSVLVNGRAAARATASVKHRTWVVVRLQGDSATVSVSDEAPGAPR